MLPFAEREESLRAYLSGRTDIAMAFLFGSVATNQFTDESDLDVAVYFFPRSSALEWEEELEFPDENAIWLDIDRIAAMETDLLVLNRAPATVAYAVLEQDRPLFIKDLSLYWRFFLTVSSAAEDFREFTREYWEIKKRAFRRHIVCRIGSGSIH